MNKTAIISEVMSYVKHRERLMNDFGAHKSMAKMKSVTRIKQRVSFYRDRNFQTICKVIVGLREDLYNILPGEKSKFHQGAIKKLDRIFNTCQKQLN